jgi:hypothetical protein
MSTGVWSVDWAEQAGVGPAVLVGVLVGVMLVGLVLWLLGGRLARAGTVVAGFVIGGLAVTSLAIGMTSTGGFGPWVLLLGVGGAIAGALLAWLLFRLWMGVTAAALLTLVVPTAVLIWSPPPPASGSEEATDAVDRLNDAESTESVLDALRETWDEGMAEAFDEEAVADALRDVGAGVGEGSDDAPAALGGERVREIAVGQARRVGDVLRAAWDQETARLHAWWDGLPGGTRTTLIAGSAVGAVLGLVIGLVAPRVMASVQTAAVGAVLLFFPAGVLVHTYLFDPLAEATEGTEVEPTDAGTAGLAAWWPNQPRAVLLSLGLITLVGLLLQWTLRKRKADS